MRGRHSIILLILLVFAIFSNCIGQTKHEENFARGMDQYLKSHQFNGTILVQSKTQRLYTKSLGRANFQFDIPNTNATKYKIASITKLFTSVLIMQLVEQGRINLSNPIATYLPNYGGEGATRVSVYHLLTATSGIESNEKEMTPEEIPLIYLRPYTTSQLLDTFCSGKLENIPGQVWNYNNADYVILGKIIEAVYHKSYTDVLSQQILKPLNIQNTGMFSTSKVIKNLANVYEVTDSLHIENTPPMYTENYYAAGGLYSTAEDLLKFADGLYTYKLVSKESCEAIIKPYLSGYGLGLWISTLTVNNHKVRVAERQGAIWGTKTRLIRVPEKDITLILLSNAQTTSIDELQAFILSYLLK